MDDLHRRLDRGHLRARRPLGLGTRRLARVVRHCRLRRRARRRDRVRRVRAGVGARARSADRVQVRRDAPAQPSVRAARCRAAVVRLVRFQCGLGARRGRQSVGGVSQHVDRRVPRNAGLDIRRTSPGRSANDVRCGVRRDSRTRRDHAVMRIRRPDRRIRRRVGGRCGVFVRGRLEVQGRLRRLARRRRRPLRRRRRRHFPDRIARRRGGVRRRRGPVLRWWTVTAGQADARHSRSSRYSRSWCPSSSGRSSTRRSGSVSSAKTRSPGSISPSTRKPRTPKACTAQPQKRPGIN